MDIKHNKFTIAMQLAKLQECCTALCRGIDHWHVVQAIYMPGISTIHTERKGEGDDKEIEPEDITLLLPSSWTKVQREVGCIQGVVEKEWRLRRAQADEALRDLARACLHAHMVKYKKRNESGQRANTRANNLINSNVTSEHYQCAYKAMLALDADSDKWRKTLYVLQDKDVVPLRGGLYDPEEKKRKEKNKHATAVEKETNSNLGEGYRTVSWIWRSPGTVDKGSMSSKLEAGMHDDPSFQLDPIYSLCIEWAHARARAMHWREEIMLLCEEMRRCVRYFRWRARWWEDQQCLRVVEDHLQEGITAYALEHAQLFWNIGQQCEDRWVPFINVAEATLVETMLTIVDTATTATSGSVEGSPAQDVVESAETEGEPEEDPEWNGLQMVGGEDEQEEDVVPQILPVLGDCGIPSDSESNDDGDVSDYIDE
ncbi:hypothetical protein M422DRAFT_51435 [Sphaerobolus stellatus SS14]|uniref:Uncharacterized protein n=1 Tax=Sphaerobolus stellatus (strain SS14) TaxID=990650 RepID=A0A0C9V1I7_SPHS4|nr:hypothetical protein M422DRAFT_51435 [Sphaerobolus stellatus SS14]